MKLETSWVNYDVAGTTAQGYFVRPAMVKGPLPGILVIQEAFGVDDFIQDVSQRFATAGYAVLAPDLFSYGGKPAPLSAERIEEAKNFLDTVPQAAWFDPALRHQELQKLDQPQQGLIGETLGLLLVMERPWTQYVAMLLAGRAQLAALAGPGQSEAKIGSVGFCLGGALSMRLAGADAELAAAVAFYGFAPPADQLSKLRAPILALYAENDPRINAGVPALAASMAAANHRFEHHTYPGTSHAFMNDTRGNFHVAAMRSAWARTLRFFATELGGTE